MALKHKAIDVGTSDMSPEWNSDDVFTMTSRQILEGKQLRDHMVVSVNLDKLEIVRSDEQGDGSESDVAYSTIDDIVDVGKTIWDTIFGGPADPVVVDGDKTIIVKCRDCKVIVNQ